MGGGPKGKESQGHSVECSSAFATGQAGSMHSRSTRTGWCILDISCHMQYSQLWREATL